MTNWELGNSIMCNLVDKMRELEGDTTPDQHRFALMLSNLAYDLGPIVNNLMDDGIGMCPEHVRPLAGWVFIDPTPLITKQELTAKDKEDV